MIEPAERVRVRRAESADAPAVWALVTRFAVSYVPTRAQFDTTYSRVIEHPEMLVSVAVVRGQTVGYLLANCHETFFADGPVVWVEEVMVEEEQRGRSIGRELMRLAEDWAVERGATYIALATRRAAGFYSALEYVESATFFRKEMGR